MASTISAVNIINMALRNLGEDAIASLGDTTRRAQIAVEFWPTTRDATLAEHPWNFATVRSTLRAYTTPAATLTPGATSGSGVTFDAGGSVFDTADVGRQIRRTSGSGRATIVTFESGTQVTADIVSAFSSTSPIASGAWRLYEPIPAWGYAYRLAVPSDALSVWRLDQNVEYQVENGYILSDSDTLNVRYVKQETDTTKYAMPFVHALVAHLASVLAKPITGQNDQAVKFFELYEHRAGKAKSLDGREGTPEVLESNALIDVR